jgi:hypothetical protein
MKYQKQTTLVFFLAAISWMSCKEVYTPPAIQNSPNYLVVDGIVINGQDSTIITLSRTRSLADSAPSVKVADALVSVVGLIGVDYPLTNYGNGRYAVDQLLLDTSQQYQLKVLTTDGNEFRSSPANVRTSPPIDSLYWQQDGAGVHIYLNTHDPTNITKYYRWQSVETWEYQSFKNSVIEYTGPPGQYILRGFDNQIFRCYSTQPSSTIEVTSTNRLSSDIVNKFEITSIPTGSEKISELYSDLVKQYAITEEAYNFWDNLRKNTEQLGSLFDLQPFSELGNISCINNPGVKCIGFISFSSIQQKRILISKSEVINWNYNSYFGTCAVDTLQPADVDAYFQPPGGPYFVSLIGTDNGRYTLASTLCVDCTYHGGSPIKPPFWP